MPFRNPVALIGLISAIPLILIYLIRPRPKDILFPSTKFLQEGEAERSAVLSRLVNDPLFWVQLLVLCALSVAAAGPFITEQAPASSHLVLVLDSSASIQASSSRALQMVEPYLDRYQRVSIILAGSQPTAALVEGSPSEARNALKQFLPKAVSADISGGMYLAAGLIGTQGGHILVVSDFINWIGERPEDTRKILQADGRVSIVFADTFLGGENVALTEGWDVPGPGYVNHTALVHNFGLARSIPITISGPGGKMSRTIQLDRGDDYYLSFTAYPGVNALTLDIDDAISWDNMAYVYVPQFGQKRVLYLGSDGPALAALQSLPSVVVERSGDIGAFDLVVVAKNSSADGEINRYIDGGRVIYLAMGEDVSPEYLPVQLSGEAEVGPASLWVRDEGFAGGLHFDEIGIFSYPASVPRRGSTTLVEANGMPVLSYWRLGKGLVVYSGLEMDSDFHLRPEYPIFWYQMVNWITGVPDFSKSNRKTGETVHLGDITRIETPSKRFGASSLVLDEAGIYRYQGNTVAANMYDPKESSLQRTGGIDPGHFEEVSRTATIEKDLSLWLIALAALAIILEIAITRRRREA